MCLGVPGLVTSILAPNEGLVMGKVSFGGVEREVCLGYTPEAKVGDYVLVHVGFALSVLDAEAAAQILADFAELERLSGEELGSIAKTGLSSEDP
jgi:hydrogenase expression/formation protein HypC